MNQSKTCVVFYAHSLDSDVLANYKKLKDECPSLYDVYFAYDNSKGDYKEFSGVSQKEVFLYNKSDLIDRELKGPNGEPSGIIPGNLHYIHLNFALHYSQYKYIWRIEYDVFYTGNWARFFSAFQDCRADLLAPSILDYDQIPEWHWWNRLYSPRLQFKNCTLEQRVKIVRQGLLDRLSPYYRGKFLPLGRYLVRCLLCIYRLSRDGAELIEERTRCGWRGHEEVLLPTLLNVDGFSIEDLGGTGRYVKSSNIDKNYVNYNNQKYIYPGTLCAHPEISSDSLNLANMLYHPVKNGIFEQIQKWQ